MAAQTFHFSRDTPPDAMFSDIQALNKFQDEQFSQLVQYVFEFLTNPGKPSQLISQLDEFATQNSVGSSALKNVFKSLLSVPNSALKKSLSPDELKEDLVNLGTGLSEEKATYFAEQWKVNLVGLSRSALSQTLMVNQLVDMEWKFGVTAASSELEKVGNTFLQLKLVINTGSGVTSSFMVKTAAVTYVCNEAFQRFTQACSAQPQKSGATNALLKRCGNVIQLWICAKSLQEGNTSGVPFVDMLYGDPTCLLWNVAISISLRPSVEA